MIWGLTLEPGKDYTQLVQDEVHLSMATMESRGCIGSKDEKYSHVMMKTNTAEYMLCTLVSGITYQQGLDLKLMPSDEVTFTVQGTNTVYLTGYSYAPMEVGDEQQPEDWIEEQSLDESFTNEPGEVFADDVDSYHAPIDQCTEQQLVEEEDISAANDEEKYSTSLEAEAERQLQQQQLIAGSPTRGTPVTQSEPGEMSGHSGASRQPEPHSTDVLNVQIKTEIHPVVEIEQLTPDPPFVNEDDVVAGGQPPSLLTEVTTGSSPTNLPSTSRETAKTARELTEERMREIELNWSKLFSGAKLPSPKPMNRSVIRSPVRKEPLHSRLPRPPSSASDLESPTLVKRRAHPLPCEAGPSGQCIAPPQRESGLVRLGWKYGCHICGRVFRDQQSQLRHQFGHRCRYCQKEFHKVSYAQRHEAIHTAEKSHKCRFCEKRFRAHSTKLQHERTHTGEKPYKCSYCDTWFNHREKQRRHERGHLLPSS